MNSQYISKVVDLTDPSKNVIYNMSHEEAVEIVRSGDVEEIRKIDGQFCLISVEGKTIRMARSIGRPIRYFIAKQAVGPQLIIAERIDVIYEHLKKEALKYASSEELNRRIKQQQLVNSIKERSTIL